MSLPTPSGFRESDEFNEIKNDFFRKKPNLKQLYNLGGYIIPGVEGVERINKKIKELKSKNPLLYSKLCNSKELDYLETTNLFEIYEDFDKEIKEALDSIPERHSGPNFSSRVYDSIDNMFCLLNPSKQTNSLFPINFKELTTLLKDLYDKNEEAFFEIYENPIDAENQKVIFEGVFLDKEIKDPKDKFIYRSLLSPHVRDFIYNPEEYFKRID